MGEFGYTHRWVIQEKDFLGRVKPEKNFLTDESKRRSMTQTYEDRRYHRRTRGPSCDPMTAQITIAAPYQIAMKGIVSLVQLNA
jgi:hypothetical protein